MAENLPEIVPDQWPPQACGMPELGFDPYFNWDNMVLNVALTRGLPADRVAASFAKNFIRLTGVASAQYNEAKYVFEDMFELGGSKILMLPVVVSHLELCVLALRRALRFVHHRKGVRLPKRDVRSEGVLKIIRKLRDAIEHTDSLLSKGKIAKNDYIMLRVKSDRMELDGVTVLFSDLAKWLRELNELAYEVAIHNQGPTSN